MAATQAPSFDRDPIEQLADSFIARFRAGERPSIEEYAAKYPDLADDIRELLPALVELELNQSPMGSVTASVAQTSTPGAAEPARQLGDYLILREIGRGGMGVVYEAVQQSLGRHVALKVMPQNSLAGSSHLERFRLEARAAARLHHTNIVPVFGVGEQEGVHYYAMQFIQGQGLDEVFEELRRLRDSRSRRGKPAPANHSQASPSRTARALTLAATHGLLTGQFSAAGRENEIKAGAGIQGSGAPSQEATQAETAGAELPRSQDRISHGSALSTHSELSDTQDDTRYYRSVARVGLQVAEAMAYAHSEGILHRDIKPSNLLLDAKGTVWVTDFGLAKAEGADALTHTGDIVGTLRYMAPERFEGWSDPRSDVYALGVTLYELLTLQYLFSEANRVKLIDRVVHEAPTGPRKLDKSIPRDLETIVLKAVAKEPAQRYVSAEQMAEDLQRFLADKPVLARRTSATEQAWRWCRRNPALSAASALALTGLVAAVLVLATSNARIARTSRDLASALREKDGALNAAKQSESRAKDSATEADRERVRAEAGEAQARAAVDEFLTKVTEDQLLKAPGLQALRRDLLGSALRFYDEFLKQRGDDASLQTTLAGIYLKVGTIHGDLSDSREAQRSFRAAKKLFASLAKSVPGDRDFQEGLAKCHFRLGECDDAIAMWQRLLKSDTTNPRYRRDLASAFNDLALQPGHKLAEVLQSHQKARALREGLVQEFPDDLEYRNALGSTLNNIGVLLDRQGHGLDALAMYQRSVEHNEAAFSKAPQNLLYGRFLGTSYSNVASTLHDLGRRDEAERWYRKTIEHWRQLTRDNPAVPVFHARLYGAASQFGRILFEQGRKADAEEPFRLAARALEELPHSSPGDLYNLACVQARVAATIGQDPSKLSMKENAERNRLTDAALNTLRRAIDGGSQNADHIQKDDDLEILRGRPDFIALIARVKAAEEAAALVKKGEIGRPEEKLKLQRDALAMRSRLVKEDSQSRRYRADQAASQHSVGQILSDLGRNDEAEKELKSALAMRDSLAREEPTNVRFKLDAAHTRIVLGNSAWKDNRLSDADRAWNQGLAGLEAALKNEPEDSSLRNELDNVKIEIANRMLQLGLMEEPGELLTTVFHHNPTNMGLNSGHYWHIQAILRVLSGDLDGFRASCGKFFKQFRNVDDKLKLYVAAMAGPDPLPLDDLKILLAAAEKDIERHPRDDSYILFAAMKHERAGNHARALGILDQTRPGHSEAIPLGAMRAIVLHHLGRDDEARKSLAEADDDLSNVFRERLKGDSPQPISDPETIIYRELMRREARSLIDGKSSPQDPYRMLGRARVLAKMGREQDAEQILAAAVAAGAKDPNVMAAFTRVLSQIGRGQESQSARTRALALFDTALASKPDNVEMLRTRGEIFASQGEWDKAATDLARVFSAGKEIKPRWVVAGTWIVGPYPFDGANPESSRAASLPPENSPDPFRPVAGPDGTTMLAWKPVTTDTNGFIELGPLIRPKDRSFTYLVTRIYSPEKRTIVAIVSSDDWLRLWCNGEELREHSLLSEVSVPLPVQLRAGWNTLLAKVSNKESLHSFKLKLTDEASEIAQAFGQYVDKQGWNDQSAAILDRLYTYLPHGVGAWEPRSFLDAEVVSRDSLFEEALTRRPKDHQLWVARGRYLAWQERWDEALMSYDKAIKGSSTLEDAHFEYACILLLKGDPAAYHKWCEWLAEKFPPSEGQFENFVRARTAAMTARTPDDPAGLVGWAEKAITKDSRAWDLHVLAMAMLRSGRTEAAARIFQDSIKADPKWLPVLNELGLALAHHQLNHAAEARRWLDQAQDNVKQYDDQVRDRANRRLPPSALTDWLEIQLLYREALSRVGKNRLADVALANQTLLAGQLLRLPLGPISLARDLDTVAMPGLFRLVAPFRTKTPVADGMIGPDEYGPPLAIDFTDDVNPGRLSFDPPNPPRNADDLSAELFLAHTRTDLFIAVRVRDDVLISRKDKLPSENDRVELYIDGDRMPGDCKNSEIPGSREGFQICAGVDGRKEYWGVGINDAAYTVGTSTFPGGYMIEFRVPLTTIDTLDGPEVKAASSGSTLRFNLSIIDNDEPVADQQRRGELWHIGIGIAQMAWWVGDGPGWPVDLHLARPVKYELVDGPKGAVIEPDAGVFTWQTPKEPQTTKITVRVRDAEKADLTDEASFYVISTAPRN